MAKDKQEKEAPAEEPESIAPAEQSPVEPEQQPKPYEAPEADPGPSPFDLQFPNK